MPPVRSSLAASLAATPTQVTRVARVTWVVRVTRVTQVTRSHFGGEAHRSGEGARVIPGRVSAGPGSISDTVREWLLGFLQGVFSWKDGVHGSRTTASPFPG
ncbi:hypothetical protein CHELA40_15040 [Chelatococcus asaccharovorans]|nr:hypothetical protein CHELA17_60580 [Chelatococcus asaccharovorans]CAH1681308.1 hypothetical protein CHELA40_15040 [Chelatococcus asaccharovorans]